MSYASAVDTEINVKTVRDVKVSILVLDPAQVYLLLNSFHVESGEEGEVSAIYSGNEKEVNVRVQISENGKQIMLEKFEGVETGKPVYLRVFPGDVSLSYDLEKNETVSVANQTSDELKVTNAALLSSDANSTQNTGMSGSVVASGNNFLAKWKYYLAGGAILVLVIGFLVFKFFMNKGFEQSAIHSNKTQFIKPNSGDSRKLEEQLTESQKRIAELQKEVGLLKNKERIQEAERKLEEDKKELEKLRKGW